MPIVWKDLFKPRYAIIVEVGASLEVKNNNAEKGPYELAVRKVADVMCLPFKRPLDVPFNVFYNTLSKRGYVIAGHKWVLSRLYGVGSCNSDNMANPIIFKAEEARIKPFPLTKGTL